MLPTYPVPRFSTNFCPSFCTMLCNTERDESETERELEVSFYRFMWNARPAVPLTVLWGKSWDALMDALVNITFSDHCRIPLKISPANEVFVNCWHGALWLDKTGHESTQCPIHTHYFYNTYKKADPFTERCSGNSTLLVCWDSY
jgi:hypothetical protein